MVYDVNIITEVKEEGLLKVTFYHLERNCYEKD